MKRLKTVRLTRRQVSLIRCLVYPAMRTQGTDFLGEYVTLLKKLERLWKEPLYNGYGESYNCKLPKRKK
jgi:hypothetical protein